MSLYVSLRVCARVRVCVCVFVRAAGCMCAAEMCSLSLSLSHPIPSLSHPNAVSAVGVMRSALLAVVPLLTLISSTNHSGLT